MKRKDLQTEQIEKEDTNMSGQNEITKIVGKTKKDVQGNTVVKAEVILKDGTVGFVESPEKDEVLSEINDVLAPSLIGKNAFDTEGVQNKVEESDASKQAVLLVALAVAKAAANSAQVSLCQFFRY